MHPVNGYMCSGEELPTNLKMMDDIPQSKSHTLMGGAVHTYIKTTMTAIVTPMMVMGNVVSDIDGDDSSDSDNDDGSDSGDDGSDRDDNRDGDVGSDSDGDDGSDSDGNDRDGNDPYLIKMLLMSDNVEIAFFNVVIISQCVYTERAHYSSFGTGNRSYKKSTIHLIARDEAAHIHDHTRNIRCPQQIQYTGNIQYTSVLVHIHMYITSSCTVHVSMYICTYIRMYIRICDVALTSLELMCFGLKKCTLLFFWMLGTYTGRLLVTAVKLTCVHVYDINLLSFYYSALEHTHMYVGTYVGVYKGIMHPLHTPTHLLVVTVQLLANHMVSTVL